MKRRDAKIIKLVGGAAFATMVLSMATVATGAAPIQVPVELEYETESLMFEKSKAETFEPVKETVLEQEETADSAEPVEDTWEPVEEDTTYDATVLYSPVDSDTSVVHSDPDHSVEGSAEVTEAEAETDNVYTLAWKKYGMSEYNVTKALKLISREGYELDPYLDYLMACTVINHYLDNPDAELYSYWGGGDASYNEWNMAWYGITNHSYTALWNALESLDTNAWSCHGLVWENRVSGGIQRLEEAHYVSYEYVNISWSGYIIGVWDRDASWY